jgi:hypothetical protein
MLWVQSDNPAEDERERLIWRGGVLPDPSCTGINRAFVERAQSMSGASWRSGRGYRLLRLSTQPRRNSLMEWSWCSRLADEGTACAVECVVERVDDQDHPWLRYMAPLSHDFETTEQPEDCRRHPSVKQVHHLDHAPTCP